MSFFFFLDPFMTPTYETDPIPACTVWKIMRGGCHAVVPYIHLSYIHTSIYLLDGRVGSDSGERGSHASHDEPPPPDQHKLENSLYNSGCLVCEI